MAAAAELPHAPRGAGATLVRRASRDARVRTAAFAYLFLAVAYVNPATYASLYPTVSSRMAFAASFGANKAVVLFYGKAYDLLTPGGYAAWRTGGTLALFAAVFGIFAAVRATRSEEDSGRAELVLSARVGRPLVFGSATIAIGISLLVLWAAEAAGLLLAGLAAGSSLYLALATISSAAVFVGIGAVVSQLASTKRLALQLGFAVFVVAFLLRVVADTSSSLEWLRWLTPLGWSEELRPFNGAQPLVLLLPALATAGFLFAARRVYLSRDIGAGLIEGRDVARMDPRLLGSTTAHALREERGALLTWAASLAAVGAVVGLVSKSINSSVISPSLSKEVAKFGVGDVFTPRGYVAFAFILFVPAVAAFMCSQISAARREEEEERLESLLAMPVGRSAWLGGRVVLALAGGVLISLAAVLGVWAGALVEGVDLSLPSLLGAGANCLPAALLFLGIATLAFAFAPRASSGISYGLLALAFLWYLFGSLVSVPKWIIEATPFAHVAAVPIQSFRPGAALLMILVGVACGAAGFVRFRGRDLLGA